MKPRIFIGSSSENKEIAEAIYMNLTDISFPEIWENFPSVNYYPNLLEAETMRVMKYVKKFSRGVTRVQEMRKK